jgi:hypothetical protein
LGYPLLRVRDKPDQLLIRVGARQIRMQLHGEDIVAGPVQLWFELDGPSGLEPGIMTLRRISALLRLGRVPNSLSPAEPRAARWVKLLRTLNGLAPGASYRELSVIAGSRDDPSAWRGESDFCGSACSDLRARAASCATAVIASF